MPFSSLFIHMRTHARKEKDSIIKISLFSKRTMSAIKSDCFLCKKFKNYTLFSIFVVIFIFKPT